jgi:heme exporter protein D
VSFDSIGDFLAMGGHGLYVWLSYALAAAVVSFNIGAPLLRRRRFLTAQQGRMRRAAAEGTEVPSASSAQGPG